MDYIQSPSFHDEVNRLIDEYHVPGLAIAISHHDKTFAAGFGHASETSHGAPVPCTADTLFDIASSSKSLTAAAVALLVDDDEHYPDIKWDTPLSKLLGDDFVMPDDTYTDAVTVEDMLSHRTGLTGHDSSYFGPQARHPDTARSVTRNIRNLTVHAPIRSEYLYCNIMYTVATHLVEVKTGLSFSDFLEKNFFKPLNMTSTSLQPSSAISKGFQDRLASGHRWDAETSSYIEFPIIDCPEAQGAGSIITSARDYLLWTSALLNHTAPVTESIFKGLTKARALSNPEMTDLFPHSSPITYAAGLEVFYYRGVQLVLHDGMIDGFASRHILAPSLAFAACFFGNACVAADVTDVLIFQILDHIVLGTPSADDSRTDWPATIRALWQNSQQKQQESDKEQSDKATKQLGEEGAPFEPQKIPLEAYVGEFWNVAYGPMVVEVRDGKLFVDASDRSFPFTLTLEHVCRQTVFLAKMTSCLDKESGPCLVEFRFEGDRAVRLGVDLEPDEDKLIWFSRVVEEEEGAVGKKEEV